MKKITILTVLSLLITMNLYSQSTTLTLPTADNASSFNVTNSSSTNLFNVNGTGSVGIQQTTPRAQMEVGGTDGLLVTGTVNNGTVSTLGAGLRLHWYPRKGAFRVGLAETIYWDDSNIGVYSIAMGYKPRASGWYSVAIGSMNYGGGTASLALGYSSQALGQYSIAIGYEAIANSDYSMAFGYGVNTGSHVGAVVIGDHSDFATTTASAENQLSMRFKGGYRLFTISDNSVGASLAANGNSWGTISDSTKKENIIKADGEYFLNSLSKLKLGSWNYKTQNPAEYRHYGAMAQEIFHYFGKDKFGVIGNDTTLASADMDGIIMICLQALEKRTAELQKAEARITELTNIVTNQNEEIAELKNDFKEIKSLVEGINKEKSDNLVLK